MANFSLIHPGDVCLWDMSQRAMSRCMILVASPPSHLGGHPPYHITGRSILSGRNCQGGHAWAHPFFPSYSLMALLYFMNRARWFIQHFALWNPSRYGGVFEPWAHFYRRDRQPSVPLCPRSSIHQTHWLVHKIVLFSVCINAFIATFSQVRGQPRGIGTESCVCVCQ